MGPASVARPLVPGRALIRNRLARRSAGSGASAERHARHEHVEATHIRKDFMAVKLNRRAFEHAKELIDDGKFVFDERDAWSEHQPSAQQENDFIERHGFEEYGKWYLGINDARPKDTKGHYEFPYGDFKKVHRCGVITAESRAGQYKHFDIEKAAHHLHEMIDARADKTGAKRRGAHHSGPAPHRSAR
jgi:hypothetical protein